MAQSKLPLGDLQDQIRKLCESRPTNRSSIYTNLTQLAITAVQKGEAREIIHTLALPVVFVDIIKGGESLTLDALGFLGSLLQFIKLNAQMQETTIKVLTEKLNIVTTKSQSRKLMWSLANIQFDDELPIESLELMLGSALLYLGEKPPVHSLSTICEALNTLQNIGKRNFSYFEENLSKILSVVFPCLFSEADRIRQLALECLEPFTYTIQKQKLLGTSYQAQLKNMYYSSLMKLVTIEADDSLKIWSFLIRAFGTEMQTVSLLNGLLKIEECALKSKNTEFRQMALEHWRFIIDCFALTPSILNNTKRIHLILVPLKSTETRTELFSLTKIRLWWHLLDRLGVNAAQRYQEVTALLLEFCFGSGPSGKGNVHVYRDTLPIAASILASVLSPQIEFKTAEVSRAFLLLDSETFEKFATELNHYCSVAFTLMEPNHRDLFVTISQAYIERCSAQQHSHLKWFVHFIFGITVEKPHFFEPLSSIMLHFSKHPQLIEAMLDNIIVLFRWAEKNEPLPTHPFYAFLKAFFDGGNSTDAAHFSSSLMSLFESFQEEQPGYSILLDLWNQLANSLLRLDPPVSFSVVDAKTLILPVSWFYYSDDDSFYASWQELLGAWLRSDPTILKSISQVFDQRLNITVIDKLVRQALRPVSTKLDQHREDLSLWMSKWFALWERLLENNEDSSENVSLLCNLLLAIEELPAEASEKILLEVKALLQTKLSVGKVADVLKLIFDPSSSTSRIKAVQKLRTCRKICKTFSTLLNARSTLRSKSLSKGEDDFVVIPPTPKTKRILTDRQKEVMRSKKLNSSLPAMYNDLSQDSQLTETASLDSQTLQVFSQSPVMAAVGIPEEEALLEPPSPMNSSSLNAFEELSLPMKQKNLLDLETETSKTSSIDELLKKDIKLQSKVTVDVIKLSPSISSVKKMAELVDPDANLVHKKVSRSDRPAPASVKAARLRLLGNNSGASSDGLNLPLKPVDQNEKTPKFGRTPSLVGREPPDKENTETSVRDVPVASALETTSTTICTPARRVELIPVIDASPISVEFKGASVSESVEMDSDSNPVVFDGHVESPKSATNEQLPPPSPVHQTPEIVLTDEEPAKEITSTLQCPATEGGSDDTKMLLQSDSLKTAVADSSAEVNVVPSTEPEANATSKDSQIVQNSLDLFGDYSEPVSQKGAPALVPHRKLFAQRKDHCTKAKSMVIGKKRGQSPSTGKRGAQILELSRKISNEPPSKKAKVTSSPPNAIQSKRNVPEVVVAATTPDGSPARTNEPWVRHTYSPYASPSAGILKKRQIEESAPVCDSVESSPTSLTKSRRVSFAFPEVSDSVDIPPAPKIRSTKIRRSLLGAYKPSKSESENSESSKLDSGSLPCSEEMSSSAPEAIDSESISSASSPGNSSPSQKLESSESEDNGAVSSEEVSIEPVDKSKNADDTPSTSPDDISPSNDVDTVNQIENGDEAEPSSSTEQLGSQEEELNSQEPIYQDLIGCEDPVSTIIDQLVSTSWRAGMLELLTKQGIKTIGDLCKLSTAAVQQLPLDPMRTIQALTNFKDEKESKARIDVVLGDHPYPRSPKSGEELSQMEVEDGVDSKSVLIETDQIVSNDEHSPEVEGSPISEQQSLDLAVSEDQISKDKFPSSVELNELDEQMASSEPPVADEFTKLAESHETEASSEDTSAALPNIDHECRQGTNFDTQFMNLRAEDILTLISRHPEKDAILLACNREILLRAFPNEK